MVSDVPVGAYLSGGMDSGGITALAARRAPNLISVTGGFDLSSASGLELGFDERARAEALSYRFQTEHYEVVLKAGDLERVMPLLTWHLEDPRVGQSYPNFYVSKLASRFVKVMLAGTGGDEIFAGYPWRYYRMRPESRFTDYSLHYYRSWQRLVPEEIGRNLFSGPVQSEARNVEPLEIFRDVLRRHPDQPATLEGRINQSLYFECKTFLHGLLLVEDKLSMAHSLETRLPFLDNDLVDFAIKLPVRWKLRDLDKAPCFDENAIGPKSRMFYTQTNDGKMILRRALSRLLPEGYTDGVKQGFSSPDASWFRGESIGYVRKTILDRNARIYDYLCYETVRDLVDEHLNAVHNRRLLIWSLLSFEWWLRVFA
jgi:Asparagine synthase (glutamine-hydrolyzing)